MVAVALAVMLPYLRITCWRLHGTKMLEEPMRCEPQWSARICDGRLPSQLSTTCLIFFILFYPLEIRWSSFSSVFILKAF